MDYLKKEDSLKLITQPYPEFRLIYPDELAEEMYRLTVGHPALLQHICFEMVNRADILQKRNMNHEDLQAVLELVPDRLRSGLSGMGRVLFNIKSEILHGINCRAITRYPYGIKKFCKDDT